MDNLKKKNMASRFIRWIGALAVAAGFAGGTLQAAPPEEFTMDHPGVKAVIAVQNEVTPGLMGLSGVLGTAVGLDDSGRPARAV